MEKKAFNVLKERGYVYQATDENAIKEILNNKKITFYFGIDPTADSLHIGHFFALTMVRRLQQMGHKAIVIVGGATALVGDPSGKSDLRKILSKEQVLYNKNEVKQVVKRFVQTEGENPAIILDNADWFDNETYVDFMRRIGIHFNVKTMLATDAYSRRLETGGLTFLEMGYMLMQAYDFVFLNEKYGCVLQVGGSDQWANIVAGADLGRKLNFASGKKGDILQGLTCPLLVKADGEKMGKTTTGTLWVSREKTTVYDFYQLFVNSFDEDVERLLAFFSDYEMAEIKKMCKSDIVRAKKIMAFEVTKLVHGEAEAKKAEQASIDIFSKGKMTDNMPTVEFSEKELKRGILITELLEKTKICASRSEARRLIEQGGIFVGDDKILDFNHIVSNTAPFVVKKGKKSFTKIQPAKLP